MHRRALLSSLLCLLFLSCAEQAHLWRKVYSKSKITSIVSNPLPEGTGSTFSGTVVDERGVGVRGATVQLVFNKRREWRGAFTKADGSFLMIQLPLTDDACEIEIEEPEHLTLRQKIEIQRDHEVAIGVRFVSAYPGEPHFQHTAPEVINMRSTASGASIEIDPRTGEPVSHPY